MVVQLDPRPDGQLCEIVRRSLAQSQAEVEALERRLAEAHDAEGRALADLRDAEQALAERCVVRGHFLPNLDAYIRCALTGCIIFKQVWAVALGLGLRFHVDEHGPCIRTPVL